MDAGLPASEVEMTDAFGPSSIHGRSTDSQPGAPAPVTCGWAVQRGRRTAGATAMLQVSDGEEAYSGADSSIDGAPQKHRRGAAKKQPVGGRSRGRGGTAARNRKDVPAAIVGSSDSPDEGVGLLGPFVRYMQTIMGCAGIVERNGTHWR